MDTTKEQTDRYWESVGNEAREIARRKNPFVGLPFPTTDAQRVEAFTHAKRDAWWRGFDGPVPD